MENTHVDNSQRVLDRVPNLHPDNRNYPVRSVIRGRPRPHNRTYRPGLTLDQGFEGACVGFGWAHEAQASPVRVDWERVRAVAVNPDPDSVARRIYRAAQMIDEWAGESYEGTSVLAGAKVMGQFGLVREYRWAFGIQDVVDTLLAKGPVVLGINWHSSMYDAPGGVVRVSGPVVGGHCILAIGYRVASPLLNGEDGVLLQNSWGESWGDGGLALISVRDLDALLRARGEACVATRRSYGR